MVKVNVFRLDLLANIEQYDLTNEYHVNMNNPKDIQHDNRMLRNRNMNNRMHNDVYMNRGNTDAKDF